MANAPAILAAAGVVFAAAAAWETPADTTAVRVGSGASVERYVYVARPEHADSSSDEIHTVVVSTDSTGTSYAFEIEFDRGLVDRGRIRTSRAGDFVSAARRRFGRDGAICEADSLWIDGPELRMETRRDGKTRTSHARPPAGRPVAVDASLLLWMRSFPTGQSSARDVYMADWSHRTVDVDVRDRGIETVTVPAGTFACRRMEVTVKVLVFRPKITFWIAVDEPHALVQHRGKRGPFTPVFLTRLVERGTR